MTETASPALASSAAIEDAAVLIRKAEAAGSCLSQHISGRS